MACALSWEESVVCSICQEQYSDPRKLPCCDHSFCAFCILKYFSSEQHKEAGNVDNRLECPLCRSIIIPPSDDFRVTNEWIQTLPNDMDVLSKTERTKAIRVTGDSKDIKK